MFCGCVASRLDAAGGRELRQDIGTSWNDRATTVARRHGMYIHLLLNILVQKDLFSDSLLVQIESKANNKSMRFVQELISTVLFMIIFSVMWYAFQPLASVFLLLVGGEVTVYL